MRRQCLAPHLVKTGGVRTQAREFQKLLLRDHVGQLGQVIQGIQVVGFAPQCRAQFVERCRRVIQTYLRASEYDVGGGGRRMEPDVRLRIAGSRGIVPALESHVAALEFRRRTKRR